MQDFLTFLLQKDVYVRFMRDRSWPYFDDWKQIFGKDRANVEDTP